MDSSGFLDDFIEVHQEGAAGDTFQGIELFYSSGSGCNRLYKCQIFGRNHILKTLHPQYKSTDFYETALFKEFGIGFQLEHPNICRTVGWRQLPKLGNCILMEFIDGITLKEFIRQGRLSGELAYNFINEICGALEYIHSKQIVHRDIKPANVMVTHNGLHVKLIDFSLSDCDDSAVLKFPAGTANYIAPEAMEQGVVLDLRADIYSLGMLVGEMADVVGDRHLKWVARKCTCRDREQRIQSVAKFRDELNSNGFRLWKPLVLAGLAVCFAMAAFYFYHGNDNVLPQQVLYSGNISYSEECRMILANERVRLSACRSIASADSVMVMEMLREALNKDYPLEEHRNSDVYRKVWHSLYKEVRQMYK